MGGTGVEDQGSISRTFLEQFNFVLFTKENSILKKSKLCFYHSPARERLELEEVDGNVRDLITRCFSFKSFACVEKILFLNDISVKILIQRLQAFFKHRPWGLPCQPAC